MISQLLHNALKDSRLAPYIKVTAYTAFISRGGGSAGRSDQPILGAQWEEFENPRLTREGPKKIIPTRRVLAGRL